MHVSRFSSLGYIALLAGGALLSACSNGNNTDVFGNQINPSPCSYQNAKIALIYPANGATGVPDAFSQVIFATSKPFPLTYDAVVTGSSGGAPGSFTFATFVTAPNPLPTGSATAPFPNPIYYSSTNTNVINGGPVTFDTGTSVSVSLNDLGTNCTPGAAIGSFTVQ